MRRHVGAWAALTSVGLGAVQTGWEYGNSPATTVTCGTGADNIATNNQARCGQNMWYKGNGFASCSTTLNDQSPIDAKFTTPTVYSKILDLALGGAKDCPAAAFEVNQHTVEVKIPPTCSGKYTATWYGKAYNLDEYHYHTPSEHTVDGSYYPMEVQHVHKAADGAILIISVFMTLSSTVQKTNCEAGKAGFATAECQKARFLNGVVALGLPAGKALANVAAQPKNTPYINAGVAASTQAHDPYTNFIPPIGNDIYFYTGSLTEPPCTKQVSWILHPTPVAVYPESITEYRTLINSLPGNRLSVIVAPTFVATTPALTWNPAQGTNHRGIQPLGTRVFYKVSNAAGSKCLTSKVGAMGTLLTTAAKYACPLGVSDKANSAGSACTTETECKSNCCDIATGGTCQASTMTASGALGASATFACPTGYNKKTNPAGLCQTKGECLMNCCLKITSCALYTCKAPYVRKSHAASIVITTVASDSVCCYNPTCSNYKCSAGLVKKPTASQFSGTASDAKCCTTASCYSYTCTAPLAKSQAAASFTGTASDATCCKQPDAQTCYAYSCKPPMVKKSQASTIVTKGAPDAAQCCEKPSAVCYTYSCPAGQVKKKGAAHLSVAASTQNCCDALAMPVYASACYNYVCKGTLKKIVPLPTTTAGQAATDGLCCVQQAATCFSYQCTAPLQKKAKAVTIVGTPTDVLCCEAQKKTCRQYTCTQPFVRKQGVSGVLLHGNGAVDATDDVNCCQKATCHLFSCTDGWVRKPGSNSAPGPASKAVCCTQPTCNAHTCKAPLVKRPDVASFTGKATDAACCQKALCAAWTCAAPLVFAKTYATAVAATPSNDVCCSPPKYVPDASTNLAKQVLKGSTTISVINTKNFVAGHEIVIDENTPIEERNYIAASAVARKLPSGRSLAILPSITLKNALQYDHGSGATITAPSKVLMTTTTLTASTTAATPSTIVGYTATPTATPGPGKKPHGFFSRIFSKFGSVGRLNSVHKPIVKQKSPSKMLWILGGVMAGLLAISFVVAANRRRLFGVGYSDEDDASERGHVALE